MKVDSMVLPNIHPPFCPPSAASPADKRQSIGVVETFSVAACVAAADSAVKAANITLVRIHMAFGIGGVLSGAQWRCVRCQHGRARRQSERGDC